jgi:hypothetical protein
MRDLTEHPLLQERELLLVAGAVDKHRATISSFRRRVW